MFQRHVFAKRHQLLFSVFAVPVAEGHNTVKAPGAVPGGYAGNKRCALRCGGFAETIHFHPKLIVVARKCRFGPDDQIMLPD